MTLPGCVEVESEVGPEAKSVADWGYSPVWHPVGHMTQRDTRPQACTLYSVQTLSGSAAVPGYLKQFKLIAYLNWIN